MGVLLEKEVVAFPPPLEPAWGGFQKLSLLDYPGKVASVLFVKGCNFRCPFCYNPGLVRGLPGHEVSWQEILGYLRERKEWLDGVVLTGGEPTLYPGLPRYLRELKEEGLSVKLDTNGSNPELLGELLKEGLVDYVAMDVKAPLRKEAYSRAAGTEAPLEAIRKSLSLLLSSGVEYEFRTTVVPTLLEERDLLEIAEGIKGAKRYYLQQFRRTSSHMDERFSQIPPYPRGFLEEVARKISGHFGKCTVRG
ncbi:MAG: anaerobic ribonucleoside-triphosphate reductase activating protein [Candidatus Hadarchaeales archaeon]